MTSTSKGLSSSSSNSTSSKLPSTMISTITYNDDIKDFMYEVEDGSFQAFFERMHTIHEIKSKKSLYVCYENNEIRKLSTDYDWSMAVRRLQNEKAKFFLTDNNKPPHVEQPPTTQSHIKTVQDAIGYILSKGSLHRRSNIPANNMPLMERDFEDAIDTIKNNIDRNLQDFMTKADFFFLVSGGAPGIGKTRFGRELFNHLEKNVDWIPTAWNRSPLCLKYLYMDFGNVIKLTKDDYGLPSEVILGLRVAYTFFIREQYEMSFEIFRTKVEEYKNLFKIDNVFEAIKCSMCLQSGQGFIFLHLDEFQLIPKWEEEAHKSGMWEGDLFKDIINGLSSFMLGPRATIFVQTFLSGTAPQAVIRKKESSRVSFRFVECPLLSLKSIFKIADHYANQVNAKKFDNSDEYKWTLCQPFLQLLEDTGGLPRAVQCLFDESFRINGGDGSKFFNNLDNQKFDSIFKNTKKNIEERYNIYHTVNSYPKLALELLHYTICGLPVRLNTCLDSTEPDCTIESLERDAHIILCPCSHSSIDFTIKMPFFFICLYEDSLQILDGLDIQNEHTMHWQDYELFVAHYEAYFNNLLIKLGKTTVTLGELYPGAYGSKKTKNIQVKLKKLSVRQAKEQFPCLDLTDKISALPIDWEKGDDVIVNGTSASWGDGFVPRFSTWESILSIHQYKYDYQSAPFTLVQLYTEHIKNLKGTLEAKRKVLQALALYRHITIVFTTQPFNEADLPDDCLLISKDNFEDYFGPVFASRAKFALTKDLNPNFSELTRMVNSLPGVGESTAPYVIYSRPYLTKEHFYKMFPQAKRAIEEKEAILNENKRRKISIINCFPYNIKNSTDQM